MLECLKRLVDIGNNGSDEINNNCLSVEKIGELIEGQSYYYQEYKVSSSIGMASYSLHNLKNFPKGSYVANTQNIYQGEFLSNENFRILIPKETLIENINGQIEISGICENYPIFYGEAPDGKQDYVLTYNSYGNVKQNFVIDLNINNGKIIVVKRDYDTNTKLQGVKFELISEDGKYKFESVTDKNGEIHFENLFPGKYRLREIQTLNEYEICEDEFEIEIKYNSVEKIEVFNELKKGNIKIVKVDDSDNKLDGVIFELYNKDMELLETLITDENGEVKSEFYPSENKIYFLKEIKSKDGYVLNEEIIKIELEEGKTVEYKIENEKIDIPELPMEPEIDEPQEPVIEEIPEQPSIEEDPIIPKVEIQEEAPKLPKTGY